MQADEFLLVRDMFATFATRNALGTADVGRDARAAAQQALDTLGLHDLRRSSPPAATAQECALLAEAHGRQPLCTSLLGTALLAPELLRLAGVDESAEAGTRPTIALTRDLRFPRTDAPERVAWTELLAWTELVAWDGEGADSALHVAADGTVTSLPLGDPAPGIDLLRDIRAIPADAPARTIGVLDHADVQRWQAWALVMVASELVGAADSFVTQAVRYARERSQYGRPIGSFQAVQHMLADASVLVEACVSATRYAAWALDHETPAAALTAARVAKAEVDTSALEAMYTGMQVFGGIAQTWEHIAHLYLRRIRAGAATLTTTADLLSVLAEPETAR